MNEEKWEQIKEMVGKNFEVLENNIEPLPEIKNGQKEILIFNSPLGKMKLEMVVKPLVISKQTIYSKRMGTSAKVNYITSDTEKVRTLLAYKWDEAGDNWAEIDTAQFA